MSETTRRDALGRGAGLAGALAVSALLARPPAAGAQEDAQTDALERIVILEQAAALAYSTAAAGDILDTEAKGKAKRFSEHELAHADGLGAALKQLGVDEPDAPETIADADALEGFDTATTRGDLVDFLIDLEAQLAGAYLDAALAFEAEDLRRTGIQVVVNHAQHRAALLLLRGDDPADAATDIETPSAVGATAPDAGASTDGT